MQVGALVDRSFCSEFQTLEEPWIEDRRPEAPSGCPEVFFRLVSLFGFPEKRYVGYPWNEVLRPQRITDAWTAVDRVLHVQELCDCIEQACHYLACHVADLQLLPLVTNPVCALVDGNAGGRSHLFSGSSWGCTAGECECAGPRGSMEGKCLVLFGVQSLVSLASYILTRQGCPT